MADSLLTIEQVAQRLAVSPKALRQRLWRAPNTLPTTIRLGKLVRFSSATLEEWLAAQRPGETQRVRRRGRPRKTLTGS